MIVWLNGTFGVGKTTTARRLVADEPRLRLFDPETVGAVVARALPDRPVADFQDHPSWRRLVPAVADELVGATGQHLLAVQTVLREDYWRELQAGLAGRGHTVVHVLLEADANVVRRRALDDVEEPTAVAWRLEHLDRWVAARPWLVAAADLVVDTTHLGPGEAAARVRAALPSLAPTGGAPRR